MATDSTQQQLRFRWNDHMQHLSKVLTLQRLQEQYCDITLVSEDGFLAKAHQAVLASTSTYFERVLGDIRPEQHPMVVLRGVNLQELTCLLDYMYQGNTQVDQNLIESVLEVADLLGVKGLSGIRSNPAIEKFMAGPPATTTPPAEIEGADEASKEPTHPPSSDPKDSDPPQTSGIDLSMAKNEPRSPKETGVAGVTGVTACPPVPPACREGTQNGGEVLPPPSQPPPPPPPPPPPHTTACRKRRIVDSTSSEDNMDSASDPDWGRIGSKVDEPPRAAADAQPRTITLTAISTAAATSTVKWLVGCSFEGDVEEEEEEEEMEEESTLEATSTLPTPHPPSVPPPPPPPPESHTSNIRRQDRLLRPRNVIKRPMNKYLLFYKDSLQRIKEQHPNESYHSQTQRVAALWKNLSPSEKLKWEERAHHLQQEHKKQHPTYVYSPWVATQRRREYKMLKEKRKEMIRAAPLGSPPLQDANTNQELMEENGTSTGRWKPLALSNWHFLGAR